MVNHAQNASIPKLAAFTAMLLSELANAKKVNRSAAQLAERHRAILKHFPTSLGVDDFIARVEVALCAYGFTGETAIAVTNLCRDESTIILKDKIESVFGSSFNTNGLGGVITCGVTGIKAGLSHAPICPESGRERYIFFSFPHIGIDATGDVGTIFRPCRPGASHACGAMIKCLKDLKAEGVTNNCKGPGSHDPLDPEYTILKQRMARRVRYEQLDINSMSLCDITAVGERIITDDLEHLIQEGVNTSKADYAVITGVQIHNWGTEESEDDPHLEFVAVSKAYVVVNGERSELDLMQLPALTPRQLTLLAAKSMGVAGSSSSEEVGAGVSTGSLVSTINEIPSSYLHKRYAP